MLVWKLWVAAEIYFLLNEPSNFKVTFSYITIYYKDFYVDKIESFERFY